MDYAATRLANIGSAISAAQAAAAAPTTGVLAAGTAISVYTPDGTTLLHMTTAGAQQTSVVSSFLGGNFNTGIAPFLQDPIYLSYNPGGTGTTIFDA
jgi:hypothetical protein